MTVELLLRREVHLTAIAFQHFASVLEDGVVVHQIAESRTYCRR